MDPNWATASDRENGKGDPDRRYYNVGQQPATQLVVEGASYRERLSRHRALLGIKGGD